MGGAALDYCAVGVVVGVLDGVLAAVAVEVGVDVGLESKRREVALVDHVQHAVVVSCEGLIVSSDNLLSL